MRSVLIGIMLVGILAAGIWFKANRKNTLVVYCSHDAVYSETILRQFEKETGIKLAIRFDTEATKSLGLVELLIREKKHPRCDVFWNNEIMGTLDLAQRGLLEPYKGPGYARIPNAFKDPGGLWVGFGGRLRVWIVNTKKMKPTRQAVAEKWQQASLSHVTIAKPLYGTTRTHYSVLWDLWGRKKLVTWHQSLLKRGLILAQSNGQTKNLVAQGVCDMGWTDTDDYFVAQDAGDPVAMLPVRLDNGKTLCIPNTAMIIKGTHKIQQARRLVDYLASAACELALSRSKARQIPLGKVDDTALPDEVRLLKTWSAQGYPLAQLKHSGQACLAWLKSEFHP